MPDLPVIVLTARAAIEQRVEGLDRGANDYVTKPFSLEELLARVRAQLRSPGQRESSVLEVADIRMDLRTRRVERDGHEVQLTAREFEVLAYLMRHPDQVLSREQILNAVWGFDFDPGTKVLEVYIGYLRRKLGDGRRRRTRSRPCATSATACGYRMLRRLLPGSLRAQLALAIALVDRARGRRQLPRPLQRHRLAPARADRRAAENPGRRSGGNSPLAPTSPRPPTLRRAAARFIAAQRYHAEVADHRLQATAGPIVTNDPRWSPGGSAPTRAHEAHRAC